MKKTFATLAGLSALLAVAAISCWIGNAKPQYWELSLFAVQQRPPAATTWGFATHGLQTGVGDSSILIQRYQPLPDPLDLQDFPIGTASHHYGFGVESDPIIDRSTGHPRMVGEFREWAIPYWAIVLATSLLPAFWWFRNRGERISLPSLSSLSPMLTAAAFLLFATGMPDPHWLGELALELSLFLAVAAVVMLAINRKRQGRWQVPAIVFNAAFWGMLALIRAAHHS